MLLDVSCYKINVEFQKDIDLNWATSNRSVWMLISKKHQPVTAELCIGISQVNRVSEEIYIKIPWCFNN